ncbi:MAG: nucleoside deaminase [Alphaproteobacteria bacterium]|nr:nucleoside deaminase [Rickettsiales bacterium]
MKRDLHFYMEKAFQESVKAFNKDEIPVGCVIVFNDKIITSNHNITGEKCLQTAHAEMLAIENACKALSTSFLTKCDLYVTMEPCPMCGYAIKLSRIRRVYFGCYNYKNGAFGGNLNLVNFGLGYNVDIYGGIQESKHSSLLKEFFSSKRKNFY